MTSWRGCLGQALYWGVGNKLCRYWNLKSLKKWTWQLLCESPVSYPFSRHLYRLPIKIYADSWVCAHVDPCIIWDSVNIFFKNHTEIFVFLIIFIHTIGLRARRREQFPKRKLIIYSWTNKNILLTLCPFSVNESQSFLYALQN